MPRKPLPAGVTADDLRQAVGRGREAQSLIESPLLTAALEALEQTYVKAWRTSTGGEQVVREAAYWGLINLGAFRTELNKAIDNADIARAELRIRELAED